ncbi:MAG: alanyl-tRNA editing protein [Pseudobutyrivibrio sp.]|nr:alanyl-tRNA editing protein [Pseudobutyrivibrio sp.]
MKSICLYDQDPFLKEFTAKLVSITENEKGLCLELNQTVFFPEQGGQSSDIGILGGFHVYDVQINQGTILHYCTNEGNIPLPKPGDEIRGAIDWEHRFNNMQQHSGEHVFTGLCHNEYGAENVGFHLSDNTVTLDLNINLGPEQIAHIEREANLVIARDLPIKAYYPSKEEAQEIVYRSKKEIDSDLRLVEIEGIDTCACCAPHVKTTGQIGMIKVVSFNKYKGGTRVYIACGLRALADYNRRMDLLARSYQALSCSEDDLPDKVADMIAANKNLQFQLSSLKGQILMEQVSKTDPNENKLLIFTTGADVKNMREGINSFLKTHDGEAFIFSGDDVNGYNFVIGSNISDCMEISRNIKDRFRGKWGGSSKMIQGNLLACEKDIRKMFE